MRASKERVRDAGVPPVNAITYLGDSAHEQDATATLTELAPFRFQPSQLAHMLRHKDLGALTALGGTDGIIYGLGTHPAYGLATESSQQRFPSDGGVNPPYTGTIYDRKRVYGENFLPTRISKTLLQVVAATVKGNVLILLSIVAVASLALGLSRDFGHVDLVGGIAILAATAMAVGVGSVNNWLRERQFKVPRECKEERGVNVIRDGVEQIVDVKEVVVGDVVLLEPGDIVPCDGVFISGHNIRCDESGATGESDAIKKVSYSEMTGIRQGSLRTDCFMISGSKVLEGIGKYLVGAVGLESVNGRAMMARRTVNEKTPLQMKLDTLAESMSKLGSIAGLVLFAALMVKVFVRLGVDPSSWTPSAWGIEFVNMLIISVTLVAISEGLPLAVSLALSIVTQRMVNGNLHVRFQGSVETMANASVICTDKNTLTQHSMTVVAGSVGIHAKFVCSLDEHSSRTNAEETNKSAWEAEVKRKYPHDFSVDQVNLNTMLSNELQDLFNEAIAINSTAFEDDDPKTGKTLFVGSRTETALLQFAKDFNWRNARETRDAANVVQVIPFSSYHKAMGVVVRKPHGGYRAYFKGASEILAGKSTKHIVVGEDGTYTRGIETKEIGQLSRQNIHETIIFYANQTLRTIALCYRDFDSWPPVGTTLDESDEVPFEDLAKDLTLIAITAIEDSLRDGVRDAVLKCKAAGISVKMCTGDNVLTARSIAMECGIFTPGGIIMEGPVFRELSQPDMLEIVPKLQVLARSSPEDKKILVEKLKMIGEVVVVTGDGTNDGPALRMADAGFSMGGITGTAVAKEASDIVLGGGNFASIVKAIVWGRYLNDSVRQVLQFQISMNITAIVITVISSLLDTPVLSAIQLLWVNIIMDTFAALSLAIDPVSEKFLDRKPDKKTASLFTVEMYKMILLQSAYQIAIVLVFRFFGLKILELEDIAENREIVKTLIFNAFVFAQIFNSVNCRRLDSQLNIFEGILKNRYFIPIYLIEIVVQVVVNFVGGAVFNVTRIGPREWGICVALGFMSIPWGTIIRLLPTKPFEWLFRAMRLFREEKHRDAWGPAISMVHDNLSLFSNTRGGRLRSSFLKTSRERLPHHDLSSTLTMVPTLVGQAPISRPVVDHISEVLDKIRADTLYIVGWEEPKDPAPNIHRRHDYSEIVEAWREIESRARRPAEFLSIWRLVEDYEKFIHELRLSISGSPHMMTEVMVNDFRRRLSDFIRDFKANANASHAAPPSQVSSTDYSPTFFKGIGNVRISGGRFIMNVTQPIVPRPDSSYSSQSETYLKEIRNFTYFRTFIELAILF